MTRENFIKVMDVFDEYFNGELPDALKVFGINEWAIDGYMDTLLDVIDSEVDPLSVAHLDEHEGVRDCGSYINEWIFGKSDFNELCKDAGALYDYITAQYEKLKQKARDERVETIVSKAKYSKWHPID